MVKVIGPLGGFDASGSLAGSIVFSKWKGRNYVRRLVKPSNPKSGGQVGVRSMFAFLAQQWAGISTANKATWNARADSATISPFNAYMSFNQFNWRNGLPPTMAYPAAQSGTADAINTFTATAGIRQITITLSTTVVADLNWGFTIYRSTVTAFTPGITNAVKVLTGDSSTNVTFVDTPLVPDTYYYDARPFDEDQVFGALKGEINATVT